MKWTHVENLVSYWIRPSLSFKLLANVMNLKQPFIPNEPTTGYNFEFQDVSYSLYKDEVHGSWSKDYLKWRFCELPQSEYHYIKNEDCDCIVRVGLRGKLKEAQVLYFNSKLGEVSKKDFNKIRRLIRKTIKPDLIGFPISKYYPLYSKMKSFGFIRLKSGANFVYKKLDPSLLEQELKFSLCGLDFHTY